MHFSGGSIGPNTSSQRWKHNIVNLSEEIDTSVLHSLQPRAFSYIPGHAKLSPDPRFIGLIAEEVQSVLPGHNVVPLDEEELPFGINETALLTLLIAEVQKLRQEVDELKASLS